MGYYRVLPRDLFNESKVLKCYGRLALILLDYDGLYPLKLVHTKQTRGFLIEQHPDSGDLTCTNLKLFHTSGHKIRLACGLNSKLPYSMAFNDGSHELSYVFNDDGEFHQDFIDAITEQVVHHGNTLGVHDADHGMSPS